MGKFFRRNHLKDRFEILSQRLAEAYAPIPEEDGLDEIDAIVSEIRHS